MPDFQLSDADSPPEKPSSETPAPAVPAKLPDSSEAPAAKASGFAFSIEEAPAPKPAPAPAPKPVTPIPGPPIPNLKAPTVPTPTVPTPRIAAPQIPLAKTPAPAIPNPPLPTPTVPTPQPVAAKVAVPPVPSPQIPTIPSPQIPTPQVASPTAATSQVGAPKSPQGTVPNPATVPRAAPVPIAVPSPSAKAALSVATASEESEADEGAPQDNFSRGLWDFGQKIRGVLDALEGPASWLLRVAAVVGICALAYILAASFFGGAGTPGNPKMAELTKNLDLASRAFILSLLAAAVASLVLGYEDNRLGVAVVILGLVFHFAAPIAIKQFIGVTPATAKMAIHFRQGGYFLVMVGLVKAVADTVVWLWNLPERMKTRHANVGVSNQAEAKQRIIAREANMMSPCWKLPFCRESIRKQCPAFIAKTTCWKFGRGCYCDTEMISRIVRGESLDVINAPTQQSRQGKPPCGRCYIYLEHQTYKFRMLSPLVLPVTVLSTWLIWPVYTRLFAVGSKAFDSIWSTLSFNSSHLATGDMKSSQEAIDKVSQIGNNVADITYITQNMFGVLLGFMVMIYLSKFIEWAIYKAKW